MFSSKRLGYGWWQGGKRSFAFFCCPSGFFSVFGFFFFFAFTDMATVRARKAAAVVGLTSDNSNAGGVGSEGA